MKALQAHAHVRMPSSMLYRQKVSREYATEGSRAITICHSGRQQRVGPSLTDQDKALQSLVETGIRGSLALAVAHGLHMSLFSSFHLEVQAAGQGLMLALPFLIADAAVLLPDYRSNSSSMGLARITHKEEQQENAHEQVSGESPAAAAAAPADGERVNALRQALAEVQGYTHRYTLGGSNSSSNSPLLQVLLLEAAGQLSEEVLARVVLLGALTTWTCNRLLEAGVEDVISLGSLQLSTAACAGCAVTVVICSLIALRYANHAKRRVKIQRTRRAAAAAAAAQRAKLLRYQPQAVQQKQQGSVSWPAVTLGGDTKHGTEQGVMEDDVAELVHGLLAVRFIAWQAAAYLGYISTGNLMTTFTAGLLLQLFCTWACGAGGPAHAKAGRTGSSNGST